VYVLVDNVETPSCFDDTTIHRHSIASGLGALNEPLSPEAPAAGGDHVPETIPLVVVRNIAAVAYRAG